MLALLLESALRLLALGGIVWLVLKILRVRNPQAQMTAWTVVLLASLSMPALMRSVAVTIPAVPPPAQLAKLVAATPHLPFEAIRPLEATPPALAPAPSAAPPRRPLEPSVTEHRLDAIAGAIDWWRVATGVYIAVAGMLLLRLLVGLGLTWRLVRRARPVSAGWAAGADVRVSDAVAVPVTFGSTILLPPECVEWSPAKLQAVLSHEGSHVAHGDFYVLVLAVLNRAVFWFSPFAWWQLTRLAELAEIISDDAAIEVLRDRPSYAGILLDVASTLQPAPAGLAMARPGTVRLRVERILAATAVPAGMGWRGRALTALALFPLVAVCAATITRATSTAQPVALAPSAPSGGPQSPSAEPRPVAVAATPSDTYVGHYQLNARAVFTVTRLDDQLFAQITGGRKLPLRPASDGEYLFGSSASRISFVTDDRGAVNTLVLRQNGHNLSSVRVDEARATAVEGVFTRQIAVAPDHFREQSPAQGSKDAVLHSIEDLQAGALNYARMSPSLADEMGRQLPKLHAMLTALGDMESIFFRGVGPGGYDIYGVKFAKGLAEVRLLIGTDGTVEDFTFRPDGDDTPGGIAGCAGEAALKSVPDTAPIKLLVFNNSGAEVTLFSVDFAGHRTRYGAIGNEMTGSILTNVARPWIIADAAGKCLEIVWPGQRTRYIAVEASQRGQEPAGATARRRTPASGGEESLRRYIDEVVSGQPNYERMTGEVAGETRRLLQLNRAILSKLGPLRAISFRGVTLFGSDIYTAHFANGSAEWRIALVRDGRIGRISLGPAY
jgi:BlaR1 peptidase M56